MINAQVQIVGPDGKLTPAGILTLQSLGGTAGSVAWADITGKPSTFTPAAHTHPQSDVTGLTSSLAAKQDTLVSGTSIKTVNGASLLGAGDLTITTDPLLGWFI